MRWFRIPLYILALVVVLTAAVGAWLGLQPPVTAPPMELRWRADTEGALLPAPGSGVQVRFLGVSTLLLDDGETAILTDGFFSRPGKLQSLLGQVEPDLQAITRGMARADIGAAGSRLKVVIPVHSHYDHVMDAPEVALRTGALLLGSDSTANVGRGWGLPEAQIRVATLGAPMQFGRFTVTLWPSQHLPTGFTGGTITTPLKPPVRAFAYKEGQSYAVHVAHGGRTLLINGTAGFVPGALRAAPAEVVLLGIGALGRQDEAYRAAYWQGVVTTVGARRVIPIHWDDFWIPSDLPFQPIPPPLDDFEASMDFLRRQGKTSGVDVRLPLAWEPMDIWAGLPPPAAGR